VERINVVDLEGDLQPTAVDHVSLARAQREQSEADGLDEPVVDREHDRCVVDHDTNAPDRVLAESWTTSASSIPPS
jgi:hypothetical protein